jgi:RNA polymerase sigma-70 factor, ECF subfamily
MPRPAAALAEELNRHRNTFKAFLAGRVGSAEDAEDILQDGLAKALRRAGEIHDESRLTAWFYQLLRHAVVDHYRARGSARRRHEALGELVAALGEDVAAAPAGWETHVCTCLGGVVATLRPLQAELLRRVDLGGEPVQEAARALGLTPNNASVTLHRARAELRRRLAVLCGECSETACLDCDCAERKARD